MIKKMLLISIAVLMVVLTVGFAAADNGVLITTTNPPLTATVDTTYTFDVDAIGDNVIFSLTEKPSEMEIDTVTGVITWTPSVLQTGSNPVIVQATNTTGTDTLSFTITVAEVPPTFVAEDINLGSSTQQREQTISTTWKVTNKGSSPITDIKVQFSGIGSEYKANGTIPSTTLGKGESMDVQILIYVPDSANAARNEIGKIIVSGTGAVDLQKAITLEAENMVEIRKVKFDMAIGGSENVDDGDDVKAADPFDDIEMIVEVKNLYSSSSNIEMDVELEVFSDDIDDVDGESDDLRGLEPGDRDELTVSFSLDPDNYNIDDEPFDIKIRVTATDDNGAEHIEEWSFNLELDVESRDIRILSTRLSTASLSCTDTSLRVDYELFNVGKRDLDEAMVKVSIPDLDVYEYRRNLEVDQGDNERYTTTLNIPRNSNPGTYTVEVNVYSENDLDELRDTQLLELTIRECQETTNGGTNDNDEDSNSGTTNGGTTIISPNNTGQTTTGTTSVTGTPVSSASGSSGLFGGSGDGYLIGLGVVVLILIVLVVLLLIAVLRK